MSLLNGDEFGKTKHFKRALESTQIKQYVGASAKTDTWKLIMLYLKNVIPSVCRYANLVFQWETRVQKVYISFRAYNADYIQE